MFRGSLTWNSLPLTLRSANSIHAFKRGIKTWMEKTVHATYVGSYIFLTIFIYFLYRFYRWFLLVYF